MNTISCCGSDCGKCSYYGNLCKGCNEWKGKVFYMSDGKTCPIYECTIDLKSFSNCGECKEVPCDIWKRTRDPRFTDEEFEKNIFERVKSLKNKNLRN